MSLNFHQVYSRISEDVIQDLFGKHTMKLLKLLYTGKIEFSFLRKLFLDTYGVESILWDKKCRNEIIDLLRPNEIQILASDLKIRVSNTADLYSLVKQKQFRRGSIEEQVLFAFFSVDLPDLEQTEIKETESKPVPSYSLFKHQRDAVNKVKMKLLNHPYKVLLHMPTGSGKTRTAMNLLCDYLRNNEPSFVVWLAASEELCDQASEEFEKAWVYLGNREINIYRFWGKHQLDFSNLSRDAILFGSMQKLNNLGNERDFNSILNLAHMTNYIVMDEAHQAVAPTYQTNLITLFNWNNNESNIKYLLGLSATPGRTWNDPEADRKLSDFFGKNKVKLDISGYSSPVDYLTDNGYLAKVNYRSINYQSINDLTAEERDSIINNFEIPNDVLIKLGEDEYRNLRIVQEVIQLSTRHKRIIVFAPSVESSNVIANVLQSYNIMAFSITSQSDSYTRKKNIVEFKTQSEKLIVLCNYGVLTTGFDAPLTSAAIIARPTLSLVLYSQMIGRAIRGEKAGGNAEAEIVSVIDQNLPGFNSVSEAFENWEDIWE